MNTPIEVKDIRIGDLIRVKFDETWTYETTSCEFVAKTTGGSLWPSHPHYLLDRPNPPFELPTEPTLGWLEFTRADGSKGGGLHRWVATTDDSVVVPYGHVDNASECVTAFTPAVAVPKAALDELREFFDNPRMSSAVNRFLAAVDGASQ